jgi:glutaconate CoA-transferase, subunit A
LPDGKAHGAWTKQRTSFAQTKIGSAPHQEWKRDDGKEIMSQFMTLGNAVASLVHDGDVVAMEGFTHLLPFAAGHEVIRQNRKDLTIMRMTPDILYDQLIGMGVARKLIFSWGGNPGVGSLHRFRDAVENNWPRPLELVEHSHAAMANAYDAGAAGLPSAFFRGSLGSDLLGVNPDIRFVHCPFTGEQLTCVPANRPDVTIIHAQKADRDGNVQIEGIVGVQKEAVMAARRSIVTVEEVVDEFPPLRHGGVILPNWILTAVVVVPGGAHPSYAHGYYDRDNSFYIRWGDISRDRETFARWMNENVLRAGSENFSYWPSQDES